MAAALVPTGAGAAPPARYQAPEQEQPPVTAPLAVLTFDRPAVTTTPAPPRFAGQGLQSFLQEFEGQRPILPGYSTAECMAIFSAYQYQVVLGRPYSSPGAKDLWPQDWAEYEKITADQPARAGDVVTWSGAAGAYQGGGWGHVAIVIEDRGGTLLAFGQNPNPATSLELSKAGVLGYLRPKHLNP